MLLGRRRTQYCVICVICTNGDSRNRLQAIEDSESTRVVHEFEEQEKATEIVPDKDVSKAHFFRAKGSGNVRGARNGARCQRRI